MTARTLMIQGQLLRWERASSWQASVGYWRVVGCTLLGGGVMQLERLTGKPTFGVVPWLDNVRLPEEDSATLSLRPPAVGALPVGTLDVAVIALPWLANFDDLDPLATEPGVRVRYVTELDALGDPHVILLPGTNVTLAALRFLEATGLQSYRRVTDCTTSVYESSHLRYDPSRVFGA